jgi:hypothetical protein
VCRRTFLRSDGTCSNCEKEYDYQVPSGNIKKRSNNEPSIKQATTNFLVAFGKFVFSGKFFYMCLAITAINAFVCLFIAVANYSEGMIGLLAIPTAWINYQLWLVKIIIAPFSGIYNLAVGLFSGIGNLVIGVRDYQLCRDLKRGHLDTELFESENQVSQFWAECQLKHSFTGELLSFKQLQDIQL